MLLICIALTACTSQTGEKNDKEKSDRFPIVVDGKWGYIDHTGTIVVTPQFDLAWHFSEGLAFVRIGGRDNGKWGCIDKTGKYIINPQFDDTWSFSEGLAAVKIGGRFFEEEGKGGYIDKTGKYVWEPTN